MGKLSKKELQKKKAYHKKRAKFYDKKIQEAEKRETRIGFVHYD
tara:strand:+ start:234 stop:365 length:132 start_codon:yes stop_codon:yes gene_type:complete